MLDPFNYEKVKRYLTWTFILIIFMLITGIAVAKDYDKIIPLNPEDTGGQFCFIKVKIKQVGDEVIKEEVLECADGRKKFDGPTYWELFADFYYADMNVPVYCRKYDRGNHAFKSFGTVCLTENGKWEVK